jgi:chemotaxis protein methyltransferase CheR
MSSPLERLVDLVRTETGISIKRTQLSSLEAALRRVDPAMDAASFMAAAGEPGAAKPLLERLIDEVTINETFFFRQRRELDALDWRRLLEGARARGSETLRVWVAACASGEEAYTLAMLASEAFAPLPPQVSILGTDISAGALDGARRGRYGRRALKLLDPEMRERYFVAQNGGLAVGEALRKLVQFRRHNLVLDPAPMLGDGPFDLIACRNVLIYFHPEAVERVIVSLESALAPEGMLVLGAADRLCGSARRLSRLDGSAAPEAPRRRALAPPARLLRRPLGRDRSPAPPQTLSEPTGGLAAALDAANQGSLDAAVGITDRLLHDDPLDADAYFIRGLAELGKGDAHAAVSSLRRALFVDPTFGLAAFKLGRAQEELGDLRAAARAYEQALRTLEPADPRHELILDQVELGDVASACAMRLRALRASTAPATPRPTFAGGWS